MKLATKLAGLNHYCDPKTGAVTLPIQPSTTFARDASNKPLDGERVYGRDQNVTVEQVEQIIAQVEQAQQALLFSSGQAAAMTVLLAQSSLPRPDPQRRKIVIGKHMYWALRKWIEDFAQHNDVDLCMVDLNDNEQAQSAIDAQTLLVFIELPTNPLCLLPDFSFISQRARAFGAYLICDATAATPCLFQPLAWGANIVLHSGTKYLAGHADVLAGVLACSDPEMPLWQRIKALRAGYGAVSSAFDAWLLARGMRTLALRVERSSANAATLTARLQQHKAIKQVYYPGYGDPIQQERAAQLLPSGAGGLFSISFHAGVMASPQVLAGLQLFLRATSLGGCESLVEWRKPIEGDSSPIPDDLLRFSVGIEDVDDLWDDLCSALDSIKA